MWPLDELLGAEVSQADEAAAVAWAGAALAAVATVALAIRAVVRCGEVWRV